MQEKFKLQDYGYGFIPASLLPPGKDEYWQRNEKMYDWFSIKSKRSGKNQASQWRSLLPDEIDQLEKNGNYCTNWENFLVCDPFDPSQIRHSNFYGLVRVGSFEKSVLKFHDFCVPCGIRNSSIISCDIGNNSAIQDCTYISHYIIGDNCILSRIDEMQTTNHSKFGNGAVIDGEDEDVRVWIDVMNETGGRSVLPFESMIASDAFLWAAYRDDIKLTDMLKKITQDCYGGPGGKYGLVGHNTIIKSCSIIKDVKIGSHCYIKGANKLKNLTILSSVDEPTQIGEGVEMVNGIVGYGSRVFYGSKAVRFVIGRNCEFKYGARLINSVLGDNSTVSCCEILYNLIFPFHEQHHNNSFLVASLVQGMSNIAAAATIGSNHNSRTNNGEIRAGRGFWPGLAVTLKHSSCFASYVLIVKGDYPGELNITLPFSLINNNVKENTLDIMPAYFWMYNLYALERNSWKVAFRDRRKIKIQHIETEYLAPDTVDEIIKAVSFLEKALSETEKNGEKIKFITCQSMENCKRKQIIVKPVEALAAYRQMLRWYSAITIAAFLNERPELDFPALQKLLGRDSSGEWVNFGGQIVKANKIDKLRRDIGDGKYSSWEQIHGVYNKWQEQYPLEKARHAWAVLSMLLGGKFDAVALKQEFNEAVKICRQIFSKIYEAINKDRSNPFKKATFRNDSEMEQVLRKDHFTGIAIKQKQKREALLKKAISRLQEKK